MAMNLVGPLIGTISWFIQVIGEKMVSDKVDQFTDKETRDSFEDDINKLFRQLIKANMVLGAAEAHGMRIKNKELVLSLVDLQRHFNQARKMLLELSSCGCIKASTVNRSSSLQVVDARLGSKRKFRSLPSTSSSPFYFSETSIFPHPKNGALSLSCELCNENRAKRSKLGRDNPSSRNRIGEYINQLREIGDDVHEALQLELLGNNSRENQESKIITWRARTPRLGRGEEVYEIVKLLISDEYHGGDNSIVVPIVGPKGVGKTELAAYVYCDERVCDYFDVHIWVYLFRDVDLISVIRRMLSYVSNINFEGINDLNTLQEILVVYLERFERVLLILDEMTMPSWKMLAPLIKSLNWKKGNKILVTTHDVSVSNMIRATNTIYLKELEDSVCWNLFVSSVFGNADYSPHEDLLPIGREICKSCGRNPLGIQFIGSTFLREELSSEHWRNILGSIEQVQKKCFINVCQQLSIQYTRV